MKLTVGAQIALMNHRQKEQNASRVAWAVETWFNTEVKAKATPANFSAIEGLCLPVKGLSRFLRDQGIDGDFSVWTLESEKHAGNAVYRAVIEPWLVENDLAPVFDEHADFVGLKPTIDAKVWLSHAIRLCGQQNEVWDFVTAFMDNKAAITDEQVARVNALLTEKEAEQKV